MSLFKPAPAAAKWSLGALLGAAIIVSSPVPVAAQDDAEARLRRAEAEIRALQRAVFPGGDGRFFEPQITADGNASGAVSTSAPSTTAVTDILARLDAIETQLQRLTALTEENTNAINLLGARVDTLEMRPAGASSSAMNTGDEGDLGGDDAGDFGATDTNLSAMTGGASDEPAATAPPSRSQTIAPQTNGPSAERIAAVQAITKPQTDDPGDDEYSYGFRLWDAGFYPEARQQLASYVEQYHDHSRITYGRNLLGRAFLDDNMPEEAARWFLRNYQADRTARRAPDSLLFLAEAMVAMGDTRRACIALAEFAETYPAIATGRLADQYQSNRRRVTCE